MNVLPLVLLALAFTAAVPPTDVTITTRSTYGPAIAGVIETVTLQLKGPRQLVRRTTDRNGIASFTFTMIAQCDIGRVVTIDEKARTYAVEPIRRAERQLARSVLSRRAVEDTRPIVEIDTIDSTDTGERRAYGRLTARHVVTTTTVEREGAPPVVANVRDGWYLDRQEANCEKPSDTTYALVGVVERGGRVDVRFKGRAPTGFPIEERDRHVFGSSHVERTVRLVEFSESPIRASVFEVPDGYTPALQLPFGGYDLTRPDTLWNRASAYWSAASAWVHQWWR